VARPDLHAEPPALPSRLTDPVLAIAVGSAAWLAVAVVLGVLAATGVRPLDVWFGAALVGLGLGGVGMLVLGLQRRAQRRGRSAQKIL
jgi:ABC-type multidrug transport system permease subunit